MKPSWITAELNRMHSSANLVIGGSHQQIGGCSPQLIQDFCGGIPLWPTWAIRPHEFEIAQPLPQPAHVLYNAQNRKSNLIDSMKQGWESASISAAGSLQFVKAPCLYPWLCINLYISRGGMIRNRVAASEWRAHWLRHTPPSHSLNYASALPARTFSPQPGALDPGLFPGLQLWRTFLQKLISFRTSMIETSCGVVTTRAPSTLQSFRNCATCNSRTGTSKPRPLPGREISSKMMGHGSLSNLIRRLWEH